MSEAKRKKTGKDELTWGIILMAIGVIFLLDRLDIATVGEIIGTYWPLILIFVGIRMVWDRLPERPKKPADVSQQERLKLSKAIGSIGLKVDNKKFTGGKVSTVMGDVVVDLSDASVPAGDNVLKLNGLLGDISVSLPKNTKVSIRANTVLGDLSILDYRKGGFAVTRRYQSEGFDKARKKLIISASQVVGDITVSHAFQ